jgi:hypothetical protein
MTTWTHLHHSNGRAIASTHFTDFLQHWPWITQKIMQEFECDYDDIDMADDDCTITVRGVPMAYTSTEII